MPGLKHKLIAVFVAVISLWLVLFPIWEFIEYLNDGILWVSPAGFCSFMGGLVGLGMVRMTWNWPPKNQKI